MLKKLTLTMLMTLFLAACSKPIPQDRLDFIGVWESQDSSTTLVISQDGRVDYKKQDGNRSTSLDAPITAFNGANFSAGVGPLSTEFVVSKTPTQNPDGSWSMIVDDKLLIRQ